MMLIGNKTDLDYKYMCDLYVGGPYPMMKALRWLRKMGCCLWNVRPNLGKMLMLYF